MIGDLLSRRKLARFGREVGERLERHSQTERVDPTYPEHAGQLYLYQHFLTVAECNMIISKINANAKPSTLYAAPNSKDFRTSFSCDLDRWDNELIRIDERICGLTGLDPRHGETMQGQRYAPGQYFKPHHDFFYTSEDYWKSESKSGGQRSWTAMIYLNEPAKGGETEFQKMGFKIEPRTGMLMVWNNMDLNGRPNQATLHSGNPVEKGTKYIITK